jgi:hypothetical protein
MMIARRAVCFTAFRIPRLISGPASDEAHSADQVLEQLNKLGAGLYFASLWRTP